MFNPVNLSSKLFKKYLLADNHPFKIRIQNLLGRYFFAKGITVVNETGTKFCLTANDWITRTILLEGEYEATSLKLSKKLLEKGGVFIDVGANFGLYTCLVAENKNVHVYSVEPNYMVMPALLNNVAMIEKSNVTVLNVALSNDAQFVGFNLTNSNNLGMASFQVSKKAAFSVLSCSLEFIFQSQQLTSAELIKIDVEGNEFNIIEKFPFHHFYVKNFIIEFNDLSQISLASLINFFEGKGFKSYDILGGELHKVASNIPENNVWFVNQSTSCEA